MISSRGPLLTIWLAILLISNLATAFILTFMSTGIASEFPDIAPWIFQIYGLLALANFLFVIFLFMWKRWAFFAYCAAAVIGFVLNLYIGIAPSQAVLGILGPLVLYLIMKSRWASFE